MKLTLSCACGAQYEVEFEPVDGRAPGVVQCPDCGREATGEVNALAAQQAVAAPAEPRPRIGLRRASAPGEAAETAASGAVPKFCHRHPHEPVEVLCFVCRKPICKQCMRKTGFVCSPFCREHAIARQIVVPVYEGMDTLVAEKQDRSVRRMVLTMLGACAVALAGFVWLRTWGSYPRVAYSISLPEDDERTQARFVGPHHLLVATSGTLSLHDARSGRALWSRDISAYRPTVRRREAAQHTDEADAAPADAAAGEQDMAGLLRRMRTAASERPARFHATQSDIWLASGFGLVRFERSTGKETARVPVQGELLDVSFAADAICMVVDGDDEKRFLTRISLPDGGLLTGWFAPERDETGGADIAPAGARDRFADFGDPTPIRSDHQLVAAGSNIVGVDVKLVKENIVAYKAMKDPDRAVLGGELKVTDTVAVAEEILTDLRRERTGGVRRVDESQYRVRIAPLLPAIGNTWTGDVHGPPRLHPLPSVNVLSAGNMIQVFDKSNRPLWNLRLPYPLPPPQEPESGRPGESGRAPLIEHGDRLYVADQGVLTATELNSGRVFWRVGSVGISRIQFDAAGMMYVTTTSADPDSLKYTQQERIAQRPVPILMKLDPRNGQKLWQIQRRADLLDCFVSGNFVYMQTSDVASLDIFRAVRHGREIPVHFRVIRLNPASGDTRWEYYRDREPREVDYQQNRILLRYPGRVEVLRFLSFGARAREAARVN
jgi:hypothetical protein